MVPSESVSPSQNPSDVPTDSIGPSSTPGMILCHQYAKLDFATHEAAANLLYGHVVSIHSTEENWLVIYIAGAGHTSWIGFVDYGGTSDYVWTDGSDANYTGWRIGEPNFSTEKCTMTDNVAPTWNNIVCSHERTAVYKVPFTSRCDAITAGYTCYEGNSTGCSSSLDCKATLTTC
eukprot:scaffold286765_cov75-Attheya_sp.AAC.1